MKGTEPSLVVRDLRKKLGLSQAALARRASIPQSHLAKIESGKTDVRLGTLRKILGAMRCDLLLDPKPRRPWTELRELVRCEPAPFESTRRQRASMAARLADADGDADDLEFWLSKPPRERVAAVEFLRSQYYALAGHKALPRLARVIQLRGLRG